MARKRVTVSLDADVHDYLLWQAQMGQTYVPVRINSLLSMVMRDELERPLVAKMFQDWRESQRQADELVGAGEVDA